MNEKRGGKYFQGVLEKLPKKKKGHSGQLLFSISKGHSRHSEEFEDDFLSSSLPELQPDLLGSENDPSGSRKLRSHYLTDCSGALWKPLESGKCTAWRWSGSKYNSLHFSTSSWGRPTGFQAHSWIMSSVLMKPGSAKSSLHFLTMSIRSPKSACRGQELT